MKTKIFIFLLLCFLCFSCTKSKDDVVKPSYKVEQTPSWDVDNSKYEKSMQIICRLKYNDFVLQNENDILAAFIADECVGTAKPVINDKLESDLFLISVFGNNTGDMISFKMYDSENSRLFNSKVQLTFMPNELIGSVSEAFEVVFDD